jgi:hypothetical protein
MEGSNVTLEERLTRAERRSRVALGAAVIGMAAGLTLSLAKPARTQPNGQEVTAPFEVRTSDGKLLLEVVETSGELGPTLRLFNKEGKAIFVASSAKNDGLVVLNDRREQTEAAISNSSVSQTGPTGGLLTVFNQGKVACSLEGADCGGILALGYPGASKWTAKIVGGESGGSCGVLNKNGDARALLGVLADGSGFFSVVNATGQAVASMGAINGGGFFETLTKDEKMLFSTPIAPDPSSSGAGKGE